MDDVTLTHEASGQEIARGADPVNAALAGTGIWVAPQPFGDLPSDIAALLAQTVLSPAENQRLKAHFLLPRERCLEVIETAGREPQVPGGGATEAYCETLGVQYPQLWVIEAGGDGSSFYPYHRNMGADGTGSDEVGQVLSGTKMAYRYDVLGGVVLTMNTTPHAGWLYTFSGVLPHGGVLQETSVGSKVLVQVLGPERFWIRPAG